MPLKHGVVTMYSCGPTVYDRASIGNYRAYVFSDTIVRVLEQAGFHVRRVINITDVGHLVGDGDEGEDKMAVGAAREHKSPQEIAAHFTKLFMDDLHELNIDTHTIIFPKATEYIKEQIAMAKALEEKGFAYRTPDGLYFDTQKFPNYGKLGGFAGASLKAGARVKVSDGKRHPNDFALWRLAKPGDLQQWTSPWGSGNPGWSIECSAMARALLGVEIDIHTGGEDHISIHHNNEIAQSESANGRQFVRYWMHNAFLTMQGEKISKSLGNVYYLSDIEARGIHPLALRYFFLQAHYRTPLSFSFEALAGSAETLTRLWRLASQIGTEAGHLAVPSGARERFLALVRDDLSTPGALGALWEALKSEDLLPEEKWGLIEVADEILGLSLVKPPQAFGGVAEADIPKEIQDLLTRREAAREAKDYTAADVLRREIEGSGYTVEDTGDGAILHKQHQ